MIFQRFELNLYKIQKNLQLIPLTVHKLESPRLPDVFYLLQANQLGHQYSSKKAVLF